MDETANEDFGRLLVVDDDLTFKRVLARALATRGFTVEQAASLDEALVLLGGADAEPPDYAVVDFNLAGA